MGSAPGTHSIVAETSIRVDPSRIRPIRWLLSQSLLSRGVAWALIRNPGLATVVDGDDGDPDAADDVDDELVYGIATEWDTDAHGSARIFRLVG